MSEQGFRQFGLDGQLISALDELGYEAPTPIQLQAIPQILNGHDVMGAAQTGTGKTAGYCLPVLQSLLYYANSSVSPARHPVRALVLVPTRELADQVYEDAKRFSKNTVVRTAVVFGGVDMVSQSEQLRAGIELLIATPGRLLDHVQQKNVSLSQTQILILDEADRMLDMGFLPDLQRIVNLLPKRRQNLLFSATFSDDIKKLASSFLNDPVTIEVAASNAAADTVSQKIYHVSENDKHEAVEYLLSLKGDIQVLIFSNTKVGASRLARFLERKGRKASAIHGDRTQAERMAVLDAFKEGSVRVLVATDVAARGLHIDELPCVINFDLPYAAEDYVHRIGRTGRAGMSGEAHSLVTSDEEKQLKAIETLINRKIDSETIPAWELDKIHSASREKTKSHDRAVGIAPKTRDEPADPWFDKPYVPEEGAQSASQTSRRSGRPVAALLGGLAKPKSK